MHRFRDTMVLLVALSIPAAAAAQARVEVVPGIGYAIGSGAEDPAPSLGTWSVGAGLWPLRTWGIGVDVVRSYGQDRQRVCGSCSGERDLVSATALRYTRWSVRHRIGRAATTGLVHAGIVTGGRFEHVVQVRGDARHLRSAISWGGLSVGAMLEHPIRPWLAGRAGVSVDTNIETTVVLPALQLVARF